MNPPSDSASAETVLGLDPRALLARAGFGTAEQAGDSIGHYKLREKIGEGGFGAVWLAEQDEPVRRRVALKIIKPGMDTAEVIARFEQERQALALMDHPHIAKVFDAGATPQGRPFFVMELVRGERITGYCDEHKLPTAERLRLFIAVCQAVQHAHQKGIIHRDLKPSNILVTLQDGVPVPKVIDFGVAKAMQPLLTDLTLFTLSEQMIGTPLYMSPEQSRPGSADIDTRSDIYSLGVLLYELLTGRTPFDQGELMRAGLEEIRRVLREQEPPKPSTALHNMPAPQQTTVARHRQSEPARLTSQLRGDLDWIVMKALDKDRARRYETANAFAADIRRHLASEPVEAGPPSQLYRLRKLIARRRGPLAAAAAVFLSLAAGVVMTARLYFQERAARTFANSETQRAEEAGKQVTAEKQALAGQLRYASRSDQALAEQLLTRENWRDGVSYLARALEFDPQNAPAAQHLWTALAYGRGPRPALPRAAVQGMLLDTQFSSSGKFLLGIANNGAVRVLDGERLTTEREIAKAGAKAVKFLCLPAEETVFIVFEDLSCVVRDLTTGAMIAESPAPADRGGWFCEQVCLSPDGLTVVLAESLSVVEPDPATGKRPGDGSMPDTIGRTIVGGPKLAREDEGRLRMAEVRGLRWGNYVVSSAGRVRRMVYAAETLVTAGKDSDRGWIQFWRMPELQPDGPAVAEGTFISALDVTRDGRRVATACLDARTSNEGATVQVWDVAMRSRAGQPMRDPVSVHFLHFSPDGSRVLSSHVLPDGTAWSWLWDAATGRKLSAKLEHPGPGFRNIVHAGFSPDGRFAATASLDGTVMVWDTATGRAALPPVRQVGQVAFHPLLPLLVTSGRETVLWSLNPPVSQGWPLPALSRNAPRPGVVFTSADRCAFSRQDGVMVSASFPNVTASMRELESPSPARAFDAAEGWLAVIGKDERLRLYRPEQGTAPLAVLDPPVPNGRMAGFVFLHGAEKLLVATPNGHFRLWNLRDSFRPERDWSISELSIKEWEAFRCSPDGKYIALCVEEESVRYRPGRQPLVVSSGRSGGRLISVYEAGQTDPVLEVPRLSNGDWRFSPDGARLLFCSDTGIRVHNARDWSAAPEVWPGRASGAVFSHDMKWSIVADADGGITIRALTAEATPGPALKYPGQASYFDFAFSADARVAAVGRDDGTARLVSVHRHCFSSAVLASPLAAGTLSDTDVSIDPTGTWLIQEGSRYGVILWRCPQPDVSASQALRELAAYATGQQFSAGGELGELPVGEWITLGGRLRAGIPSLPAAERELAAWFFAPASDRPAMPGAAAPEKP